MAASKLNDRTEAMTWDPPILRFTIVRHGAVVLGSKLGDLQDWEVDFAGGKATLLVSGGKRLLYPRDAPLVVKPLAAEIAAIVIEGREDARIQWRGPNYVSIRTGKLIPATNKQTTGGRRRRFTIEIERLLLPHGWHRKAGSGPLIFKRAKSGPEAC